MKKRFALLFIPLCFGSFAVAEPVRLPAHLTGLLANNCTDCHDESLAKGGVNLDVASVDWSDPIQRQTWEQVLKMIRDGIMPPADKPQPPRQQRSELIAHLDQQLVRNTPFGKTKVRRLSNREYEKTIQTLFKYRDFKLQLGFPPDHITHGFDNLTSGLQVSKPLLQAYVETANGLADRFFHSTQTDEYEPFEYSGGPEQMTQTFSSSEIRDNGKSLRLASRFSGSVFRACSWSSDMEIRRSGVYEIRVEASQFKPKSDEPMILELRARQRDASDRTAATKFRLLGTLEVTQTSPEDLKLTAVLHDGETVMFRWANSEYDHTRDALKQAAVAKFKQDRRYLAAWQDVLAPKKGKAPPSASLRGMNGHVKAQEAYRKPELDLADATLDSERTKKVLDLFARNSTQCFCDTWAHLIFEEGPCLQVHGLEVIGPSKIVDSLTELARRQRKTELLGRRNEGESDALYLNRFLRRFLPQAFRSEVSDQVVEHYASKAKVLWGKGASFDESMHVMLRSILLHPRFLHRDMNFDAPEYDLASRLSYFLTSGPPDSTLLAAARSKAINNDAELEKHVKRLLPRSVNDPFVQSFPKQWLNTRSLDFVMPDAKLKFSDDDLRYARSELKYFFHEILKGNRPLTDFIDPDFCYTTTKFAEKHYKIKNAPRKKGYLKIPIKRGHPHGGLLAMAPTMIATANGVDTQPVVRGVWLLEHVIGRPPPEPPKDVPALTPDIRGATTPRELLTQHTSEPKCAGCHQLIDPFGFAFENYNAVGDWRNKWPKINKKIDPSSRLFDGTAIQGPADLRQWMLKNIDIFGQCLSEKLMTYALGREPNYRERAELRTVVQNNIKNGQGFRELVIDLVKTKTFRASSKG